MIFTNKYNFGITNNIFLNEPLIGYLNLGKVKTSEGLTVGDSTSIDKNIKLTIKKCYSEYLERFAMGIPLNKNITIESINLLKKDVDIILLDEFGYGKHFMGHNDTTGTASGDKSDKIIKKAICELIEKNEVLCFWYGKAGKILDKSFYIEKVIKSMGFLASEIYCFLLNEISNFPTIIVLGFYERSLITTGVSCSDNIIKSIYFALQEAKIVEWQQYNNRYSNFSNYTLEEQKDFYEIAMDRKDMLEKIEILESEQKHLILADWVEDIKIKLLFSDVRIGVKTVKCISENLLSSIPTITNISESLDKEVVKKYYKNKRVDCPIV